LGSRASTKKLGVARGQLAKQSTQTAKAGRSTKPSALKRNRQNEKLRIQNMAVKTRTKSAVKKVVQAVSQGEKDTAQSAFVAAASLLQKAAAKGVLHKRNASRKISRMAHRLNKLS